MKYIKTNGAPIKAWIDHVPFDDNTRAQLVRTAEMPFIFKHIAAMPDVHGGLGATVGSVIATKGAVIPAAVGVDIGCGMMAVKTSIKAEDLPDNLFDIRCDIEAACPHGRTDNGGKNDVGGWGETPDGVAGVWKTMEEGYSRITDKHPKARSFNTHKHLGTLGTGNHFIEICLDESDCVWVMLHSGSRGLGNRIGQYFIEKGKEEMRRWFINLPDKDLSYLVEGSELYGDYINAVEFAQKFAETNRAIMMEAVISVLRSHFPNLKTTTEAVNCHHNYIAIENHHGANVIVTRKGAVRARRTDYGIIPGSMGARSFIVRGKGNKDSFCSCSHGAGRVMSRTEANKVISIQDHIKATEGVECRKDRGVLDESPAAYKDIDAVMRSQEDLVEIVHTLKQVVCVKG